MASTIMFMRHLVNRGVMNDKGQKLGKIRAIAVNIESGRIAYAVLNFGGPLNLPKLFAVPWELMRFSSHDLRFILNVPRETLASGLAFDTLEQVMAKANFAWLGGVYEYYSDKPDWEHKRQEQTQVDVDEAQRRRAQVTKMK
jgi:sporulation protein YlmC with PRC-barrel domain